MYVITENGTVVFILFLTLTLPVTDTHSEKCNWQFQSDEINYCMAPPLYGKITSHEP